MKIQAQIPLLCGILGIFAFTLSQAIDATFKGSLEHFSSNLFGELVKSSNNKNIIYSPFSTQICLAMVRMGADGETAAEMDQALGVTGQSVESIANNYYSLLADYENSGHVHVANKVYVMKGQELQENYSDVLEKKFLTAPESIDFGKNNEAAHTMNKWVESNTNNLIKDIVRPSQLSEDTRLVLLNAIHFKGEWLKHFETRLTSEADFYVDESNSVKVQMMSRMAPFAVGVYPELEASAIKLPYKDTDLSMLIVLPDSRTGLADLLEKLSEVKLDSLTSKMNNRRTRLSLPKFSVEYEIELTQPLEKLGMKHMFRNANFGKMLKSSEPIAVSKVLHKAFIKVTEVGTEAAAVTKGAISARIHHIPFVVDHPFYYAIVNHENVILFQGTVLQF